jgi:hypothetical protein
MCPSGQATIRTGCPLTNRAGPLWKRTGGEGMLLLEDLNRRSLRKIETNGIFTQGLARALVVVSGAIR